MVQQTTISLPPHARGYHLITDTIKQQLPLLPKAGILQLFIQHTSAGLTINENADPDVRLDFEQIFNRLVPENLSYIVHTSEGPDDMPAHIKASIVGCSVQIPIYKHQLNLGQWQGIYLCEFRNHATARRIIATMLS